MAHFQYLNRDYSLSYFRTEHGAEVDLIIETPQGSTLAIEIKSSENPSVSDIRSGLRSFKEIVPKARLICLCNATRLRIVDDIEILPWKDFLDEMF